MLHDIKDRDDDGFRMKVTWQKAENFLDSFATEFFRLEADFRDGKYGRDWPFRKWVLLKCGVSFDTVLTVLKAREDALNSDQRNARNRAHAEAIRERKEAVQQRREQAAARKAERAVVKAAKEAEKEAKIKEEKRLLHAQKCKEWRAKKRAEQLAAQQMAAE